MYPLDVLVWSPRFYRYQGPPKRPGLVDESLTDINQLITGLNLYPRTVCSIPFRVLL